MINFFKNLFLKKKQARHYLMVHIKLRPYGQKMDLKFMVVESQYMLPDAKDKVRQEVCIALDEATVEVNKIVRLSRSEKEGLKEIKL